MLSNTAKSPLKSKKSVFRRVTEWLHLWLGLMSGIILFVVCLTGGIWVWRQEVWYFTEGYQHVKVLKQPVLPPIVLLKKSSEYLLKKKEDSIAIRDITYGDKEKSVACTYDLTGEKYAIIYLNPYTGAIIKDKRDRSAAENFFIFIRAGHRFFWLPQKIGSFVVGSACLVFLIILITGLIWWYPKKWTTKTREKSFRIKWNAKWKRLNIDIHNVLGFYSFLVVMLLTISGIVFTFDWFENGIYRGLTWKGKPEAVQPPISDTTVIRAKYDYPVDVIWDKMVSKYKQKGIGRLSINIPKLAKDTYRVSVNFGDGTIIYNSRIHYYDGKTLKELTWKSERSTDYDKLSIGEKAFRMNFDIHTGQILGLPTKILAFIACIIGASLPVTGVIIWYNRKWGKKKKIAPKRKISNF